MKTTTRNAKHPRRKRPSYPSLEQLPVGSQCLMQREECGFNLEHREAVLVRIAADGAKADRSQRVLRGAFVFARLPAHPVRSSHIGAKQAAKIAARNRSALTTITT